MATKRLEGKDFFDNIRSSVKISHFAASIIPLSLLVYFSLKYVYPEVTGGDVTKIPVTLGIILLLAVTVSVLGLILLTKATNSSIASAEDFNTKLNSLFEITKQLRESLYLDTLLQGILKSAMTLIPAESGALLLFDESGSLCYKVTAGMNSAVLNNRVSEKGKGIAAWVAETGKSALIDDVSKDSRYCQECDKDTGFATKSVLIVPLIYANEILGVLDLRSRKNNKFTKQDEALLHSLADQAGISIVQNRLKEVQQSDLIHITEILVSAQDYIQNQKGHARRVASYSNMIGKLLDFPEQELRKLHYACLLHDIGMLRLDADEQMDKDKVMQHPRLGYDLIKSLSLWSDSADIILHHHEKYDGTGYPYARKDEEIPIAARVLAVADSFDKLTNKNLYPQRSGYLPALEKIEADSGTSFDPRVVNALKTVIADTSIMQE